MKAACVEGNVLFLRSDLQADTLRALISIDGHDDAVAEEVSQQPVRPGSRRGRRAR
jgi:hypothetical protein